MDLIREILAAHESGISRDGLLAWARLRGDPQMTDEQLDAALTALGDEVVDVQGFLYLRAHAPAGSAPAASAGPPPAPAWGQPPPPAAAPPPAGGWPPPDQGAWGAPPAPPGSTPVGPDQAGWPPPDQPAWIPPAEQPASTKRSMMIAAVAVGAFVVLALGVSAILRAGDSGAPAAPTPTAGTVVSAQTLEIGDCLILPSEDTFDDVRTLACTEPHDAEVFFVGDHPDGDFPSDEAFESFIRTVCLPAFAAYTGSEYDAQEVLEVGWFTPTEGSWGRGDREVSCHLTPADGSQSNRSWAAGNP